VRQVDDEGIETRAFLRFENLRDGGGIEGIGPEPVDRLRRQGDDLAAPQQRHGAGDRLARALFAVGEGGFGLHGRGPVGGGGWIKLLFQLRRRIPAGGASSRLPAEGSRTPIAGTEDRAPPTQSGRRTRLRKTGRKVNR